MPVGIYGTVWAYLRLRDDGEWHRARIDWWGNITFAIGLSAVLVAVTYGIQPYGGHTMGWTSPWVVAGLAGGIALLVAFGIAETRIAEPMFQLSLFRIRAFTCGNLAGRRLGRPGGARRARVPAPRRPLCPSRSCGRGAGAPDRHSSEK